MGTWLIGRHPAEGAAYMVEAAASGLWLKRRHMVEEAALG